MHITEVGIFRMNPCLVWMLSFHTHHLRQQHIQPPVDRILGRPLFTPEQSVSVVFTHGCHRRHAHCVSSTAESMWCGGGGQTTITNRRTPPSSTLRRISVGRSVLHCVAAVGVVFAATCASIYHHLFARRRPRPLRDCVREW